MTYAVQADLEARFGAVEVLQLLDRDGNGTADTGVLNAALTDADNEVDGYLAARYLLPLVSVPALVVRLACDIARYRLFSIAAPEQVRLAYEDATGTLKRISNGSIVLSVAGVPSTAGTLASMPARTMYFTENVLDTAL